MTMPTPRRIVLALLFLGSLGAFLYFRGAGVLARFGFHYEANAEYRWASYLRTTLPYEAACTCSALTRIRKNIPDQRITDPKFAYVYILEQTLLEHLLRLDICLADPRIPESDKQYARAVMPKIIAYARTYDIADAYEAGKTYDMAQRDIVLPAKMVIRDVFNSIIKREGK